MSFRLTVDYESELPSLKGGDAEKCVNLEVSRLHTVNEICQSLYRQLKDNLQHDLADYGLFLPEKRTWLTKEKAIGRELSGINRTHLQYKLKLRSVIIRFLDASSKIIIIDESLPVKTIVANICKQLNLDHPEELSLVVTVDYAVDKHHPASTGETAKSPVVIKKEASTINGGEPGISPRNTKRKPNSRPGSAGMFGRVRSSSSAGSSSYMKKQISRKHQIRIDTPWLDPNKSLREQDVTKEDELLLMYRYYYNIELDRNSTAVEMLYKQARATFLAKEMLCAHEEIPKFSAILCQIAYGNFISKEDTQEKLHKFKKMLLPAKLKSKLFVKDIAAFHLLLSGLKAQEAMCWFIKLWSSMNSFGMEFISCSNMETREKGLIGVSKNKIVFLNHNTKKTNLKLDMSSLISWDLDSENVATLNLMKDGGIMKLILHFPGFYSSIFADCLQGNRDISSEIPEIQQAQKEFQFDEELEIQYSRYSHLPIAHRDIQKVGSRNRHKRSGSLTLNDVLHWSEDLMTPLVSQEEKNSWKNESWENPAFGNLDKLMDERFSFLDFENDERTTTAKVRNFSQTFIVTSSPESSPSTERLYTAGSLSNSPLTNPHLNPKLSTKGETHPSPLALTKIIRNAASVSGSSLVDNESSSSEDTDSPNFRKMKTSEVLKTEIDSCT